jgi:HPr kinase/phosphorylase
MNLKNHRIESFETHHGVLLNISGNGVFIIGEPGIGKSSLALDYIHNGHRLIADDCIEFKANNTQSVIGHCPAMLAGLLHTRELGLIAVSEVFSLHSWQSEIQLDYVVHLKKEAAFVSAIKPEQESYSVCDYSIPMLTLDINTPASLINRIDTWLNMQSRHNATVETLNQRQQIHKK